MAPPTRASCKIAVPNQDQNDVSPFSDIQSNPLTAVKQLTTKPRPEPRPKQTKKVALDAVDKIQNQRPKRGRSGSDTNAEGKEPSGTRQPPTKRSKKTDTTSLVNVPPRSPLPMRINRVINPGAPDQKRARRTTAAVAAATQLKEKLKSELERMERDKIRMLAEMEAVEEEEQREEERMVIRDVTDLAESSHPYIEGAGEPDKDTVMTSEEDIEETDLAMAPVNEQEGPAKMWRKNFKAATSNLKGDTRIASEDIEETDLAMAPINEQEGPAKMWRKKAATSNLKGNTRMASEDIEETDLAMAPIDELEGPVKMQQKKKAARSRGDTRMAIDKEKVEIAKTKASSKSGDRQRPTTTKPKTTKFPSGLVPNWQTNLKIPKVSQSQATKDYQRARSPLGGLADDDAHAERPIGRDHERESRKNELVMIYDSDSDFIEYATGNKMEKSNGKVLKQIKVWDSDPDFIEYVSSPKKPGHQSKTKSQASGAINSRVAKKLEPPLPSTSSSSSTSADVSSLPEFARTAWTSRFLPTLYHRFGNSNDPWKLFTKGNEMLSIIQEVINTVYPDIRYRVKWGDRICTAVNSRLYSKRSFFGSRAIQVVEEFFKTEKFINNPEGIAQYAKWAVTNNGPALWRVPTPRDRKHNDEYIRPVDIFESDFIIQTFAPFVRGCKDSCEDYGYLLGALALSATGVERAFKMFFTGVKVNIGQFSRDNTESLVADYIENTEKLSERRWKQILERCGAEVDIDVGVSVPCLDKQRRTLYIPSSPAPMDESDQE